MVSSVSDVANRTQRQISAAIAVGSELEGVLSSIARAAAHLCRAPMATIALLTDSPDVLEVVGTFGIRAPLRGVRIPVASSLNGLVIGTGRGVRSTDVLRDRRSVVREVPQMTGARGALAVPLRNREGPFGTLGVAKRMVWHFSDRDAMLLTQLADSASIAIQNAQLREQLRGTARDSPEPVAAGRNAALTPQPMLLPTELHRHAMPSDSGRLSPRQREIITLVATGKTYKEIASILSISGRTVEHHLERLKLRFHQPRIAALVGYMITQGLTPFGSEG
jgi:DNA-binding CsgD family transcriptional regulator